MSNVTMTKFPVVGPSGAKYRVKVRHVPGERVVVRVYKRGLLRRWRKVAWNTFMTAAEGATLFYRGGRPDYVAMARFLVDEYDLGVYVRERSRRDFAEWDGK